MVKPVQPFRVQGVAPAGKSAHVVEVSEANFDTDVIDYSLKAPVVVDFWATWCGPCQVLSPILEKLAEEYAGAFRVAKIDVDQNPNLARAARVQSIPAVLAIHKGMPVDQFVGALPAAEVRRFVDSVLTRAGITPPAAKASAPPDPQRAEAFWRDKLKKDDKDGTALLELGRLLLRAGRVDEAKSLLERIDAKANEYGAAQSSLKLLALFGELAQAGGETAVQQRLKQSPEDPRSRYLSAVLVASQGKLPAALETLIDLVARAPADVRSDAKRAASVVLEAAGRDDDRVEALRRRLAQLLF
jgi:putative thioredoxin